MRLKVITECAGCPFFEPLDPDKDSTGCYCDYGCYTQENKGFSIRMSEKEMQVVDNGGIIERCPLIGQSVSLVAAREQG
jgi:hypothetical protein